MRLIVGVLALLVACGDNAVPFATCEETRTRVCELACECADGNGCRIQVDGGLFQHDDVSACLLFWRDTGCADVDPSTDFGSCNVALDGAVCETLADGKALVYPDGCQR